MLNKKEVVAVSISVLILGLSISIFHIPGIFIELNSFLFILLAVFVMIAINISAKKVVGYFLESEVEIKLWEIRRFGFKPSHHFKKPFPLGAVLPIVSKLILFPLKGFVWMACLVFDVTPKSYRAVRRHGLYSFSEMTEYHLGIIAASGIFANLFFAVIAYFLGLTDFARISVYYSFFNILPLSDLDGNKIFFGNLVIWSFLAALVAIAMLFAIFVV